MFTTVYIGHAAQKPLGGRMVTPPGVPQMKAVGFSGTNEGGVVFPPTGGPGNKGSGQGWPPRWVPRNRAKQTESPGPGGGV